MKNFCLPTLEGRLDPETFWFWSFDFLMFKPQIFPFWQSHKLCGHLEMFLFFLEKDIFIFTKDNFIQIRNTLNISNVVNDSQMTLGAANVCLLVPYTHSD